MSTVEVEIVEAFQSIGIEQSLAMRAAAALNGSRDREISETETRLGERFSAVEARMTSVERQLVVLDGRITSVEQQMVVLDGQMTLLQGRMSVVEGRMTKLEDRFAKLEAVVAGLVTDVTLLKWMMGFLLAGMVSLVLKAFVP